MQILQAGGMMVANRICDRRRYQRVADDYWSHYRGFNDHEAAGNTIIELVSAASIKGKAARGAVTGRGVPSGYADNVIVDDVPDELHMRGKLRFVRGDPDMLMW